MNEFVANYPGVIISLLSSLVAFIALLLGLLFRMVAQSNKDLTMEVRELRELVQPLMGRMLKIEAVCEEREKHCPVCTR